MAVPWLSLKDYVSTKAPRVTDAPWRVPPEPAVLEYHGTPYLMGLLTNTSSIQGMRRPPSGLLMSLQWTPSLKQEGPNLIWCVPGDLGKVSPCNFVTGGCMFLSTFTNEKINVKVTHWHAHILQLFSGGVELDSHYSGPQATRSVIFQELSEASE